MEPNQLQLVFNVIGITGISSLGWACYLLRKENRRLESELHGGYGAPEAAPASAITKTARSQASPHPAAASSSAPTRQVDIRHFAADRRKGWVKGLSSTV